MKHYNLLKKLLQIIDQQKTLTERDFLELQKLRLGNKLLEADLASRTKQNRLEYIKAVLPFFTTVVAILGLAFTFFSQQKQINTLQQQHIDEKVSKTISLLSSANSEFSKSISLSQLSIYLDSAYLPYNQQITDLLISYAESEPSDNIRSFIKKMLVSHNPALALNRLMDRNRELQQNFSLARFEIKGIQKVMYQDTLTMKNLIWNINAMIGCINRLGTLHDLDFSGVALAVGHVNTSDGMLYFSSDTDELTDSLVFKDVSFFNAVLSGIRFTRCQFTNVWFDNSTLTATSFNFSKFTNCSFKNFDWAEGIDLFWKKDLAADFFTTESPRWSLCNMVLSEFAVGFFTAKDSANFFDQCKWNIKDLDKATGRHFNITQKGNNVIDTANLGQWYMN